MIRLFAFSCGWFQAPLGFFVAGGGTERLYVPVPAYLIEHPRGLALFDTGLGVRHRREAGFRLAPDQTGFEFDESADIAARLRAIDVDPGKIRWIINSHFHLDHCGGNASIPNATVIIQDRERAAAAAADDIRLYNPADFDHGHPVLAIDGEHDLYGDGSVVIFPSYGHTPGHQSVRVSLASGDVVLAADCCYLQRNLDRMELSSGVHDSEASLATLRHLSDLRRKGARIFYGHDGEFWKTVNEGRPIL